MRISPLPLLLTALLAAPLVQAKTVQTGPRKPQVLALGNKSSVSLALPILRPACPTAATSSNAPAPAVTRALP